MKKKILIIEDEFDIVSIYQISLDDPSLELFFAKNGQEGFDSAKSKKPDLIILDLVMPEMDGFIFLDKIIQDEKLVNIPIIIVTNLGEDVTWQKLKKFNIKEYIMKDKIVTDNILEKVIKNL